MSNDWSDEYFQNGFTVSVAELGSARGVYVDSDLEHSLSKHNATQF